jgi:nitrite reductase (NADH) large subunit
VRTPRTAPAGRRILIVGGSIAGHTAAQTARTLDPGARITLVTDEHHGFYSRLNLTRFLCEEIQRDDLFEIKPEWYAENQVHLLTDSRVIGLDPIKKTALLAEGRELEYDACILTHGSGANMPPFYRPELEGVHPLRTLDDVEKIAARARRGTCAAVIGGGVLGLEAAFGLVKRGAAVSVFEWAPHLMPRQLDRAGAALFAEMIRAKGIDPHTGTSVKELLGSRCVEGLSLADGSRFDAELVVMTTGIKPNIDWVRRSGIHCKRGVVVDDRMQTSTDSVFAAGDVAEWRGNVVGLWANAIEQAKVAAANTAGRISFYAGFLPVTVLKCLGIPLVSMGEIAEDGGGISSRIRHDLKSPGYCRIVFREGIPIGAVLLGTTSGMGEMRKLIENGLALEHLRRKLVPDDLAPAANA